MTEHAEDSKHDTSANTGGASSSDGVSRRRLIRAGLVAAPVVAALKSNTVLAGSNYYCVPPSSFASIRAALEKGHVPSHYTTGNPSSKFCRHPDDWKGTSCNNKKNYCFHSRSDNYLGFNTWPKDFGTCNVEVVLGYHSTPPSGCDAKTAKLASYLTSFYLCADSVGNDSASCYLQKGLCKTIWRNNGAWSPSTGINWGIDDTLVYLEYLCKSGQCRG